MHRGFARWSFYISEARERNRPRGRRSFRWAWPVRVNSLPRPFGGEGGEPPALSSAGARRVRGSTTVGTAETMNGVRPYRTTRSLARTGARIKKAHELRHTPTDTEQAAWCRVSRTASSRRRRNHLCKKSWTPCGRYRRRSVRRSIMDPLTRLAPADEGAGCDPPSPPRGRGRGIRRIERFVNVETRGRSGTLPRQRARCPRYERNLAIVRRPGENRFTASVR